MDGKRYFMGAVYNTDCKFGSINDFFSLTSSFFNGIAFDKTTVVNRLDNVLGEFDKEIVYPLRQKGALYLLATRDLLRVRQQMYRMDFEDVEQEMRSSYEKYIDLLEGLGFIFDAPALFIVNSLPEPYQAMSWFAFAADSQDEKKYGIKKGLYFLRRHLRPTYSPIMLGHEMIHKLFSEADATYYARGLEEGIANVLGIFYLAGNVYGMETAKRYFSYMYLSNKLRQSSQLYYEFTKQAAFLAREFGFGSIISLIKKGRAEIKRVEEVLHRGEIEELGLEPDHRDPQIEKSLAYVSLCFVRNLVASPLAFYVANTIARGDSVEDIAKKANSDIVETKKALEELQTKLSLIIMYQDKVGNADLGTVFPAIRYNAAIQDL